MNYFTWCLDLSTFDINIKIDKISLPLQNNRKGGAMSTGRTTGKPRKGSENIDVPRAHKALRELRGQKTGPVRQPRKVVGGLSEETSLEVIRTQPL